MTTILTTAVFKKKGTQTMTAIKYINDCYRYSGGSSSSTLIKTAGAAWVGYQVKIIIVIMIIIIIMGWIPGENNLGNNQNI